MCNIILYIYIHTRALYPLYVYTSNIRSWVGVLNCYICLDKLQNRIYRTFRSILVVFLKPLAKVEMEPPLVFSVGITLVDFR